MHIKCKGIVIYLFSLHITNCDYNNYIIWEIAVHSALSNTGPHSYKVTLVQTLKTESGTQRKKKSICISVAPTECEDKYLMTPEEVLNGRWDQLSPILSTRSHRN